MQRCKKCIIPEGYPGISFNEEGICNFCLNHKSYDKCLGKDSLVKLLRSVKKRAEYDCVVPLSGGKDSTYVLYYTVRELGLSPVAVNYDSGFQSEMARSNVRLACETLKVPLKIRTPKDDIQKRVLKETLSVSEIVGSFVGTCINCEDILRATSLNVAKEYGVPFILWGDYSLESLDYRSYGEYRSGKNLLTTISEIAKGLRRLSLTPTKMVKIMPRLVKCAFLSIRLRIQMGLPLKYAFLPMIRGMPFPKAEPQVIHFFDYIHCDPSEQVSILEKELKWQHPKNRDSRFDCLLQCFENSRALQLNHISFKGTIYCNLIRDNLMDREDALAKEEDIKDSNAKECKKVLEELNLTTFRMPSIDQK